MLARASHVHAGPIRLGEQQLKTQNLRQAFAGPLDTVDLKVGNLYLWYLRDRLFLYRSPRSVGISDRSCRNFLSSWLIKTHRHVLYIE